MLGKKNTIYQGIFVNFPVKIVLKKETKHIIVPFCSNLISGPENVLVRVQLIKNLQFQEYF